MRAVSSRSSAAIVLGVVLAISTAGAHARADEPESEPEPEPAPAGPPPPPASPPVLFIAPPPRDYDAPDPHRGTLTLLRAAANISFINWVIWQYDWIIDGDPIYLVTARNVFNNPVSGFPFDTDTLNANFFGHPYSGAIYFGAARSTGLNYWETVPFVAGGSFMWELLAESQKPAVNDLVATSLGGITLGEMLYRLSSLALDDSTCGFRRITREIVALGILPTRGLTRVETGEAWANDAPPVSKYARIRAHGGIEHVNAGSVTDTGRYRPGAVVSVDAEYGDLVPAEGATTIPAYDFFDLKAGAVITSQPTKGFEVSGVGLLHGWSSDVTSDEGPFRDNNVVGFVQSIDYHGSNGIQFASFGLGGGDFLVFRDGPRKRLRLGLELEWAPVAAVVSKVNPYAGTTSVRDYNFSMGASAALSVRWDLGPGRLALSARELGTLVINGIRGREELGYARLSYEASLYRDLFGVGVASKFMHQTGSYAQARSDTATQLSLELYAMIKL